LEANCGSGAYLPAPSRARREAAGAAVQGKQVDLNRLRTYLPGVQIFTAIDAWIGKTLFVPPIIKLCQLTRQSQFAISRLFWFIAALDGFYRAETLFWSILWGGLSIMMMISATRRADDPTSSFMFLRLLGVFFLLFDVMRGVAIGEWAGTEFWILVLVAEYAATIRTVPPRESKSATKEVSAPG
jgi:hypothetical protein